MQRLKQDAATSFLPPEMRTYLIRTGLVRLLWFLGQETNTLFVSAHWDVWAREEGC